MTTIELNDEIYKELHIIKKSEWEKMGYTGISIHDKRVRTAFLPNYGTTLFFENMHFLIIPDNAKTKTFAIWRNHKVIGYCDIAKEVAEKANCANNAVFYFGFDSVTNPEKY